jgi:hypothetical protein
MWGMAIYSLNLKSIGRTTHAAGTAGAHILYIARPDAKAELVAEHMPIDPNEARAWLNRGELADRKNARVADKIRLALPRELSPEQRMQLVQDFARDLTGGRVAWFAGIHAEGKDAHNPHCHMVIRDRDIETGKRVLHLSDSPRDRAKMGLEPKAVEWVRAKWEDHANRALEAAGHDVRIDRRSLEAQGIDREPTIHIGPQAAHVEDFVERPKSKVKETGNGRIIDYPQIDEGRTRKERHAEIVDFNMEKAARSKDFRVRETAKLQREQMKLDRQLENTLIAQARARTQETRALRRTYRNELKVIQTAKREEKTALKTMLKEDWTSRRSSLAQRHGTERETLKAQHGRITARVMRVVDITGRTRRRQDDERKAMQDRHADDRAALISSYRALKRDSQDQLANRHDIMRRELRASFAPDMRELANRHAQAELEADRQRQMRAAERERAEAKLDEKIRIAEQIVRQRQLRNQSQDRSRGFDIG